jgi:probable HAF family extracellular repeat protein
MPYSADAGRIFPAHPHDLRRHSEEPMKPVLRTSAVLAFTAATLAPAPLLTTRYVAVELGTLGGSFATPHAINDRGQVVGESAPAGGFIHAFLWQHGRMFDLGVLPGDESSFAYDINNRGQIVGEGSRGLEVRALLWDRGEIVNLTPPGATFSRANAINDRGQIVGIVSGRQDSGPVLWEGGVAVPLATLSNAFSEAHDINNQGLIVGTAVDSTTNLSQAVIWKEGQVIPLGTLPGDDFSVAFAVNDRGQVVGISGNRAENPEMPVSRAFIWERGVMSDLGVPPGDTHARALDINDRGLAVGVGILDPPFDVRAALFYRGAAADLRDQSQLAVEARAINNRGHIVGISYFRGINNSAVLWVPERGRE